MDLYYTLDNDLYDRIVNNDSRIDFQVSSFGFLCSGFRFQVSEFCLGVSAASAPRPTPPPSRSTPRAGASASRGFGCQVSDSLFLVYDSEPEPFGVSVCGFRISVVNFSFRDLLFGFLFSGFGVQSWGFCGERRPKDSAPVSSDRLGGGSGVKLLFLGFRFGFVASGFRFQSAGFCCEHPPTKENLLCA